MSRKRTHAAHQRNADETTVRNRKKTLRERFTKMVDKLDCPGNQKVFLKQGTKSIIDELVDIAIWDTQRKFATSQTISGSTGYKSGLQNCD